MNEIIRVAVKADVGQFISDIGRADTTLQKFGSTFAFVQRSAVAGAEAGLSLFRKSLEQTQKAGRSLTIRSAASAASIGLLTREAAQFEQRMRNVNSVVQLGAGPFNNLFVKTLSAARKFPQPLEESADALYQIVSAGFDASEGLDVLDDSALAASAGLTNVVTAGNAIVAVLKAYGEGAYTATQVSDILFQTVNAGIITFEELATGIGDWIGMAAAAKVPVEDAAAALAAMTRAGLQPAEASTSLARMLQAFIEPSERLNAVVRELGYESGLSMVQILGLEGAVDKLRIVTGGGAEEAVELFDEIRAARGILSLFTSGGQNYAETAELISDKTGRMNATQKAFNAQSEGTTVTLQMMKNALKGAAITFTSYLLPPVKVAARFVTLLANAIDRIPAPVKVLLTVMSVLGTTFFGFVGLILLLLGRFVLMSYAFKLAAGGVNFFSKRLLAASASAKATSASINRVGIAGKTAGAIGAAGLNKYAAATRVAGVGTGFLATQLNRANGSILKFFGGTIAAAVRKIPGLTTGMRMFVRLASMGGKAVASWLIYDFVLDMVRGHIDKARDQAKELRKEIESKIDVTSLEGVVHGAEAVEFKLRETMNSHADWAARADGFWGKIGLGAQAAFEWVNPFDENALLNTAEAAGEYAGLLGELRKRQAAMGDAGQRVSSRVFLDMTAKGERLGKELKFTNSQVMAVARSLGVDLFAGGQEGEKAMAQVSARIQELIAKIGGMPDVLEKTSEEYQTYLEDLEKATEKFLDNVSGAFNEFDPIDEFSNKFFEQADEDRARASEEARKIRGEISEIDAEIANLGAGAPSSAVDELLDKRSEAASKLGEITDVEEFSFEKLREFYLEAAEDTGKFLSNINTAIEQGYDPGFIAKLLEAGPREASRFLDTIINDTEGKYQTLISNAETLLSELQLRAIGMARLVARATSPEASDQLVQDLPLAMKIQQVMWQDAGLDTTQEIATRLNIPNEEIARIKEEFGFDSIELSFDPGSVRGASQEAADNFYLTWTTALSEKFEQTDPGWLKRHIGQKFGTEVAQTMARVIGLYMREHPEEAISSDTINEMFQRAIEGSGIGKDIVQDSEIPALIKVTTETAQMDMISTILMGALEDDPDAVNRWQFGLDVVASVLGTEEAGTKIVEYASLMGLVPSEVFSIVSVLGDQAAMDATKQWIADLNGVAAEHIVVKFDENKIAHFYENAEDARREVNELDSDGAGISIEADTTQWDSEYDRIIEDIRAIEERGASIPIRFEDRVPGNRNTPHRRPPRVIRNADGGEHHEPFITRTLRVFGEPETGGEAYIPLGMSKRNKSTRLLFSVARMFGYDMVSRQMGGFYGASTIPTRVSGTQPRVSQVKKEDHFHFHGNITGVSLEDAENYARKRRRQEALTRG